MRQLPPTSRTPFDLGPGPPSALLLHGFAGSPYELRPLGEVLAEAGYRAVGPVLAGHERDGAELARVDANAILESARQAARRLEEVQVLCGFSMGALVASLLAPELPQLRALVLMAPAIKLRGLSRLAARLVREGLWPGPPTLPNLLPADCGARDGRRYHPGFREIPVVALGAFESLRLRCLESLHRVQAPTLILQGTRDKVVSPRAVGRLPRLLAATEVEHRLLRRSHHMLVLDQERELLFSQVLDFLRRHAPNSAHIVSPPPEDQLVGSGAAGVK